MKRKILFSALIGMALLLAACGSAATPIATAAQPPATVATAAPLALPTTVPPTVAPATVAPATAAPATTAPVSTPTGPANLAVGQNATLGSFLTDSNGMTLYLYTQDTANTSNCSGSCAASWPPFLTNGAPVAGTGVTASMLGTITRADGTTQVTYNGFPLYYSNQDTTAGSTNGEGVGSNWYVMTPAGTQK
jgi:predicted lipoprotein with Yx(FWY)xxD motif